MVKGELNDSFPQRGEGKVRGELDEGMKGK